MRILLSGIAGFLGHHVANHLLENTQWEIVGLASFRHRGDPMRVEALHPSRVSILYHDLNGPISARLRQRIGNIDAIVNLASESHVDRSIEDPLGTWENNTRLIGTMLEYARQTKPSIFLQCSTDEVYGPVHEGELHKEWDTMLPSNPYAASKAAQEMLCIAYWRTYGLPLILTNTMNLFGRRQDKEKFVPMTIQRILNGDPVPIHANGEVGSRCWIHARNYGAAVRWLLEQVPALYPEHQRPLRYNVVGERLTNLEMAQLIAHHADKPLRYELKDWHSTRPGHDLHYGLDGTALRAAGWNAPVSLSNSLRDTVQWTMEHPEWLT